MGSHVTTHGGGRGDTASPWVTDETRRMLRAVVRARLPDIAERLIQDERVRAFGLSRVAWEALVQEAFADQVTALTRLLLVRHVAEMLPRIAERVVLAEIARES